MTLAIHAILRAGPFSGWKEYTVTLAGNRDYRGLVSASKCCHPNWHPLHPAEPIGQGAFISALVEVQLHDDRDSQSQDHALVLIQNDMGHEFVWVHKSQLVQRSLPSLDELLAGRPGAK